MTTLAGQIIEEFRRRAFYMDGTLLDEQILLFFKIDGSWHSISFSDGVMSLRHLAEEPVLDQHDGFDKEFAYPTFAVEQLNKYVRRKIHATWLYKANIPEEHVFGLHLCYGDNGFSFVEDVDGNQSIKDGTPDESDDSFELVRTDIRLND